MILGELFTFQWIQFSHYSLVWFVTYLSSETFKYVTFRNLLLSYLLNFSV